MRSHAWYYGKSALSDIDFCFENSLSRKNVLNHVDDKEILLVHLAKVWLHMTTRTTINNMRISLRRCLPLIYSTVGHLKLMPNTSFDAELNGLQYESIGLFEVEKYNGYSIKILLDKYLDYVWKLSNCTFSVAF